MSRLFASCCVASLTIGSLALGSLALLPQTVLAQAKPASASAQAVPSSAPPPAGQLETGPEIKPAVPKDIPDREGTGPSGPKQTQRKLQGKVVETEVTRGKNTYYVKPNDAPAGLARDVQSNEVRGAQWKVYEFKPTKKKPQPVEATGSSAASSGATSTTSSASAGSLAPPPPPPAPETK